MAARLDQSFSKADRLAVLHVIEGKREPDPTDPDNPYGGETRVHVSLAFVAGIKMPYFPYRMLKLAPNYLAEISKQVGSILSDTKDVEERLEDLAQPPVTSGRPRALSEKQRELANRLSQEDNRMRAEGVEALSVIEKIEMGGKAIVDLLEFDDMFNLLCDLEHHIDQLHIVTNIKDIPWDWLYNSQRKRFLSDLFGIGLSSHAIPFNKALSELRIDLQLLNSGEMPSDKCVLHFYGRYRAGSQEQFETIDKLDAQLVSVLRPVFDDRIFSIEVTQAQQIETAIEKYHQEVELIIFSGHFEREGYVFQTPTSRKRHFGSAELPKVTLKRRPIVIFGGCSSQASEIGTEALHDAFMEQGASACLVTSDRFSYKAYEKLLPMLISELVRENKPSIGRALQAVRKTVREQTQVGEALRMSTYRMHIHGDPTATIW